MWHWQSYMWHWQIHLWTFGDRYYLVIFTHDFSQGSSFHEVPYELNIHGTDSQMICIFLPKETAGVAAQW